MSGTLHVLNRNEPDDLAACMGCVQTGDAVLFIEEAVNLLVRTDVAKRDLVQTPGIIPFHALLPDLVARGISDRIPSRIVLVDFDGFVELSLQHDRVLNW